MSMLAGISYATEEKVYAAQDVLNRVEEGPTDFQLRLEADVVLNRSRPSLPRIYGGRTHLRMARDISSSWGFRLMRLELDFVFAVLSG
jgi:hypothetical protein